MVDPRNAYEIVGVLREVFGVADHDLAVFSRRRRQPFSHRRRVSAVGIVSSPLRLLAETRQQIQGWPLFAAIESPGREDAIAAKARVAAAGRFSRPCKRTRYPAHPGRRGRSARRNPGRFRRKTALGFSAASATCDARPRWHPADHGAKSQGLGMAGGHPALSRTRRHCRRRRVIPA